MREIHIDLSSDNYSQNPKVFGGYAGEHNESKLIVKLPDRMIRDDIDYYYFEFQTVLKEHITSPNVYKNNLSNNNEISIILWEQLLPSAGNLNFCVNAINLGENDTVTIKGKTSICTLHISESPNGKDVLIDPKSSKEELQKSIDSAIAEAINTIPQADWQQNDETANDYVKNRPGGYNTLTEFLPETTLNFTDSNRLALTTNCPPIEVGKKYIVTFDGTEYELVGKLSENSIACIGNESFTWGSTDTGEPFLIFFDTYDNDLLIYISSSETIPCIHNIKIKAITPIKIDEKYLDIKNTNIVNGSAVGSLRTVGSYGENSSYTMGEFAFAEGLATTASGNHSHAEGYKTTAKGDYSHAEGRNTLTGQMGLKVIACEKLTDTTGTYTLTSVPRGINHRRYSVHLSSSKEDCGEITAVDIKNKKITVNGYPDIPLSTSSSSTANYLTIVGSSEFGDIVISGDFSHTEGNSTKALGDNSHSEGDNTIAEGTNSHAEGIGSKAVGVHSHAQGNNTQALAANSSAAGNRTVAGYANQFVVGKFNNNKSDTFFEVGNGADDSNRSNAFEVYTDGHAEIQTMGSTDHSLTTKKYVDEKISAIPSGGTVDDVQINGESTVTDGVANIPIATNKKLGVIKVGNGLFINSLGNLIVSKAGNGSIDSRNDSYSPIVPSSIDYAVKAAMCDGKGAKWTVEEQAAARSRMGIGNYELIEEYTLPEEVSIITRDLEPDGTPYSFKSMAILIYVPAHKNVDAMFSFNGKYSALVNSTLWSNVIKTTNTYSSLVLKNIGTNLFELYKGSGNEWEYPDSTVALRHNKYSNSQGDEITGFVFGVNNSVNTLPVGTNIKIYGVRVKYESK